MEKRQTIKKIFNSKGDAIFKKMLDDRKAIKQHLKKGGKLSELKKQIQFVKPLSIN